MKNKIRICLVTLLFFVSLPIFAQNEEDDMITDDFLDEILTETDTDQGITEKAFSLYGYLQNYSSINILVQKDNSIQTNFGNTCYLRLKGDWKPEENLSVHTEAFYSGTTGNQNPQVLYESYGLSPIDQTNYPLDDFNQAIAIDQLYGTINVGLLDIQFGKIPLAWGTGYAFNPTARVAVSAFMDTVAEETPGTLAVTSGFSIIDGLAIQGYLAFQEKFHKMTASINDGDWNNLPFGIKVQTTVGIFDCSFSFIKEVLSAATDYKRNYYAGTDFVGAIWDFGVYGEAVLNLPTNEGNLGFDFAGRNILDLLEISVGFDYEIPLIEVTTMFEYYHQGPGEGNKNNYDFLAAFAEGRYLQARDYLFLLIEKNIFDYYTLSLASFFNINDLSAVFVPGINYDMYSNFQVSVGGYFYIGSEGSEFNGEFFNPGLGEFIDLTEPAIFIRAKLSF